MKRPPVSLQPGTSTAPAGRAAVLAVALVALGGCVTPRPVPTFSAYWYTSSEVDRCPPRARCIAYTESFEDFETLRQEQRRHHLELVDFDARITDDYAVYAGAWRKSDLPHDLHIGLTWGGFTSRNHQRSLAGEHLVNFAFYEDHGKRRVAAIWSTGSQGEPAKEMVRPAVSWKELSGTKQNTNGDKLYLDQIEVYDHPNEGAYESPSAVKDPWLAGVWRTGEVATRVLEGLACNGQAETTEPTISGESSGPTASTVLSHCELLTRLYAMNHAGFRAVDFERYTEAGAERWVVLLQKRNEPDWLLFPGNLKYVTNRDEELKWRQQSPPYALFDLDILNVVLTSSRPGGYHEGVAHDGSTSGPPP